QHRQRADPRAGLQRFGGRGAMIDDLRTELVAHHDVACEIHHERPARPSRAVDELLGVLQRVKIGAANPAGERLDEYLSRAWLRNGEVRDHELLLSHDTGTHMNSVHFRLRTLQNFTTPLGSTAAAPSSILRMTPSRSTTKVTRRSTRPLGSRTPYALETSRVSSARRGYEVPRASAN